MLKNADHSPSEVISFFAERGIGCGLLVPTATGLEKSIMDAHTSLRTYFRERNFHDYETQPQGTASKVVKTAWLVGARDMLKTTVSMYRPETKLGDPRIWISKLPDYTRVNNLLALLVLEDVLYVINTSDKAIWESGRRVGSPFAELMSRFVTKDQTVANELLGKLRNVGKQGFVYTLRAGSTGVGMTLETMLGIKANSSRLPDYRGIEIKATRVGRSGKATTRATLFSQVPDWKSSEIKNGVDLVRQYGYERKGRQQLNCSISSSPNTLGLFLEIENARDILHAKHRGKIDQKVVQWAMALLRNRLRDKHKETFWVKAETRGKGAKEEFRYVRAAYTSAPLIENFGTLIETGHIETDFIVWIKEDRGKARARDHGYLFKMREAHMHMLFPRTSDYTLL